MPTRSFNRLRKRQPAHKEPNYRVKEAEKCCKCEAIKKIQLGSPLAEATVVRSGRTGCPVPGGLEGCSCSRGKTADGSAGEEWPNTDQAQPSLSPSLQHIQRLGSRVAAREATPGLARHHLNSRLFSLPQEAARRLGALTHRDSLPILPTAGKPRP